jgi:hypothetical protein
MDSPTEFSLDPKNWKEFRRLAHRRWITRAILWRAFASDRFGVGFLKKFASG